MLRGHRAAAQFCVLMVPPLQLPPRSHSHWTSLLLRLASMQVGLPSFCADLLTRIAKNLLGFREDLYEDMKQASARIGT